MVHDPDLACLQGAADSREIIEKYELFHPDSAGKRLKTHVVLATYESLVSEAALFRRIPRWELLVSFDLRLERCTLLTPGPSGRRRGSQAESGRQRQAFPGDQHLTGRAQNSVVR